MNRICQFALSRFVMVLLITLVAGCSSNNLSGTWRTVSVRPEGERAPFEVVTFEDDRFTATTERSGKKQTAVGTYRKDGDRLVITTQDGVERSYRTVNHKGGTLILALDSNGSSVESTMQKVD